METKLPKHLAVLFDTPAKRERADKIMAEGRRREELRAKQERLSMELTDIQVELNSIQAGTWEEDYCEEE